MSFMFVAIHNTQMKVQDGNSENKTYFINYDVILVFDQSSESA